MKYLTYLIFLSAAILAFSAGCSHTSPYYRSDVNPPAGDSLDFSGIQSRIILIGDAGAPLAEEPVLKTLAGWSADIPEKTLTIFLGDNIYPAGLPPAGDPRRPEGERRLLAQVEAVASGGADFIFIPGNHDWGASGPAGRKTLYQQERFLAEHLSRDDRFLPRNGEAGPEIIDRPGVRVIIIDTHRWIFEDKIRPGADNTAYRDSLLAGIAGALSGAGDRNVLVVGHHPLATHGPHGGHFDWTDHLFPLRRAHPALWLPLPVIGSLYPLVRWHLVRSNQDLNGSEYKAMIDRLTETFSANPPLAYAAGHEHSLQVLEGDDGPRWILVSGSGAEVKKTGVGHGDDTLFAHQHTGFMVLDFFPDDRVLLRVVEHGEEGEVFRHWLE